MRQDELKMYLSKPTKASFINLLNAYDLETKAKYGQNFIYNLDLLKTFLEKANLDDLDKVLEIGSGAGTFSYVLAKTANELKSIEVDRDFKPLLSDLKTYLNAQGKDLDFIFEDALKLDWSKFYPKTDSFTVVSNLPYNLTTKLITKAITEAYRADKMLFLVEKSAAPRILGKAGDGKSFMENQGYLTKLISTYGSKQELMTVSRHNFYPEPRVDSKLILFTKDDTSLAYEVLSKYSHELNKVIETSFSMRRKTLANNFKSINKKKEVRAFLAAENLSQSIRAEELSANDFAKLLLFLLEEK